ncbi:MAG TPA: arsenate reductase ArsC [Methylophilaceae bacterium]|nr:arsenate reductase ArsC [Methylophilaceae bacterium]
MNILFLCTGNSCRSILAEATFNLLAPDSMHAMSAGSNPTGEVHPRSIALLKEEGIPTDGYYSKSWNDLPYLPDIVITVCGNAADETCPAYLGKAIRAHWGVDDPAKATGTEEEINESFKNAYMILRRRIEAFLALDINKFANDSELTEQLHQIGQS